MIFLPWYVQNYVVVLLYQQQPPCNLVIYNWCVHQVPDGKVVSMDNKLIPYDVVSKLFYFIHYHKELFLGYSLINSAGTNFFSYKVNSMG